jgi:hypothetical protein
VVSAVLAVAMVVACIVVRGSAARPTGSGSTILSPSVLATWIAGERDSGDSQIHILVLWRGSPGWFTHTPSSQESTGGDARTVAVRLTRGGVVLELSLDARTSAVSIQGQRVDRHAANVALVDSVDEEGGPRLVGLAELNLSFADWPPDVARMVSSSPLVPFLRCETPFPGSVKRIPISPACPRR